MRELGTGPTVPAPGQAGFALGPKTFPTHVSLQGQPGTENKIEAHLFHTAFFSIIVKLPPQSERLHPALPYKIIQYT